MNQTNESVSYGVYFDRLKASDYLLLLNEGWRRSGKHLYKPYNSQSCCPCYSIRLPVSKFQPNKQQRKISKRMQQLLSPTNDNATTAESLSTRQPESTFVVDPDILSSISAHLEKSVIQNYGQDFISFLLSSSASKANKNTNKRKRTLKSLCQFQVWKNIPKQYFKQFPSTTTTSSSHDPNDKIIVASTHVAVALTNLMQNSKKLGAKIPSASTIAKSIVQTLPSRCNDNKDYTVHIHPSTGQIHLWISTTIAQKRPLHHSTNENSKCNDVQNTLQNYFSSSSSSTSDNGSRFRMVVKCVPSNISAMQPEVHRLFVEYQSKIHGDKDPFILPEEGRRKRKQNNGHKNNYKDDDWDETDVLEDDHICDNALTLEDFDSIYSSYSAKQRKSIYKNYVAFYRFLCESPLSHTDDGSGCFHLQYFIHDEQRQEDPQKHLVAVGVVDVLPTCVSSVYAFYDPDLSKHLELGKLTALYEINWTKDQRRREFYYLGYYIHSCIKMKYKAQYRPSQLLCLSHYKWVEFDEAKRRIEQFFPKYCPTLYQQHNKKKKHTPFKNDNSQTAPQDPYYHASDDHFIPKINSEPFSCHHVKSDKKNIIENLLLDIGEPSIVSASMLTPQDRAMINPVLSEFVDRICLPVAQGSVIRLYD